jgi:hypothetical protein
LIDDFWFPWPLHFLAFFDWRLLVPLAIALSGLLWLTTFGSPLVSFNFSYFNWIKENINSHIQYN